MGRPSPGPQGPLLDWFFVFDRVPSKALFGVNNPSGDVRLPNAVV